MEENKKSKELIDDDLMEVSGGVGLEDAEDLEDAEVNDTVGGEIDAAGVRLDDRVGSALSAKVWLNTMADK